MENNKKLTRSRKERMIAGVCGGLAEYFGWDPTLVRIVYALATIFTAFAGIIIYLILWIIMPEERYSDGSGWKSYRNQYINIIRVRTHLSVASAPDSSVPSSGTSRHDQPPEQFLQVHLPALSSPLCCSSIFHEDKSVIPESKL